MHSSCWTCLAVPHVPHSGLAPPPVSPAAGGGCRSQGPRPSGATKVPETSGFGYSRLGPNGSRPHPIVGRITARSDPQASFEGQLGPRTRRQRPQMGVPSRPAVPSDPAYSNWTRWFSSRRIRCRRWPSSGRRRPCRRRRRDEPESCSLLNDFTVPSAMTVLPESANVQTIVAAGAGRTTCTPARVATVIAMNKTRWTFAGCWRRGAAAAVVNRDGAVPPREGGSLADRLRDGGA